MEQIDEDFSISIPVKTAQAVQAKGNDKPISLEALGLLTNLLSYSGKWKLHKTELYKRFGKNKETSVKSAWKNLMESKYIIEFRYRSGKKWEFKYFYRKRPFSDTEKAEILAAAEKEHGEVWGLDFQDLKMKSSKSRGNQELISNKKPLINKDLKNDDDKRNTSLSENDELLIANLREETKDELNGRSFNSVVRKVVDKHSQGKVKSFRDYLVTALIRKIEELELRRLKDKAKIDIQASAQRRSRIEAAPVRPIPFYNWLEE
jgi:hypothetical protein